MAANEYYTQYNPPQAHPSATKYQGYSDRLDSPLPIPPKSPFDDQYAHHLPSSATPSVSGRLQHETDPFADNNAIPLKGKYGSQQTIAPILSHNGQEDDFIRDADPRQPKRHTMKKDGWFSGKITWCVYVLTSIQLVVFIVEIARNGKLVERYGQKRSSADVPQACSQSLLLRYIRPSTR